MTANLASGPLNLVNELVFIRLYITSTEGQILRHARGTLHGQIYRPSDYTESMLYEYRCWLLENNPRELALKEVPGLYPIPSLSVKLAEYLTITYRATRWGELDRESWSKLIAKCAGGLSLVDESLTLTLEEASLVNKYDVWSGSLSDDRAVDTAWSDMVPDAVGIDMRRSLVKGIVKYDGFGEVERSAMVVALRSVTGHSLTECKSALIYNGWDMRKAETYLRSGK